MGRVGCATRKVSLRVAQVMWPGVRCGGVLLRHWLGEEGDLGSAIPHSAAAGALATTGKKLTERHLAPCVFFVHRPSLMQASLQRSVRVQKKPSSVA